MEWLSDIAREIGWIDVLDVALVSALLYVLIAWLRRNIPESALRRILLAAPVAAGVYILLRLLDLYLLESVVRVLFIVFVIVAVVVFQADIRRMVDLAVIRARGRHIPKAGIGGTVDAITEAAARMAELHMGALIAVKGREPLDSHIQGGVELDGELTPPLLLSIFHPETPGHDGAVLVENERISKFAAHLPLADNVPDVSRYGGTRHAAALGLAEVSDAMVVVISEERGSIGVAHERSLTEDVSVSDLKERLEAFWEAKHSRSSEGRKSWWRRPSLQTAFFAVILAILFWLLIVYSPNTVIRTLNAPIELRNLPDDWIVEGDIPSTAEVVLSGPEQLFLRLNPAELTVSIDASEPDEGSDEIVLARSDLDLPAGINLNQIQPRVLHVRMRRLEAVRLPVLVRTSGSLPESLVLISLRADPDSVTVLVPQEEAVFADRSIQTQDVNLNAVTGDSVFARDLDLPETVRLPSESPGDVLVRLDVSGNYAPAQDDEE